MTSSRLALTSYGVWPVSPSGIALIPLRVTREYDYSSTEELPRLYFREVAPPTAPQIKEEVRPFSGPHILTVSPSGTEVHEFSAGKWRTSPVSLPPQNSGAEEGHLVVYGSNGTQVIRQIVPPKVKDSGNGFVVYGGD